MAQDQSAKGTGISVPVLCKFWSEDGVWNGIAEDLAVAAFGNTFDEAVANTREAIASHLEAVIDSGQGDEVVRHLQARARDYGFLSLDDLVPSTALLKMLIAIRDHQLVAVT
jgi:predicted RNase H-like HicB family nuclease